MVSEHNSNMVQQRPAPQAPSSTSKPPVSGELETGDPKTTIYSSSAEDMPITIDQGMEFFGHLAVPNTVGFDTTITSTICYNAEDFLWFYDMFRVGPVA